MRADGTPLQFDGRVGSSAQDAGVFFTAGIADEAHGLFGLDYGGLRLGTRSFGAHDSLSVVNGCCPGEGVALTI